MRECRKCREQKDVSLFPYGPDGRRSRICKPCHNDIAVDSMRPHGCDPVLTRWLSSPRTAP